MVSLKIVHVFDLPGVDCGEALAASLGATLIKGMWRTEDDIMRMTADADAVICAGSVQPFNRRVLSNLTKCRIVASSGVGFNSTDVQAATDLGIVFTNVPDASLDEVSGRAIAFMLALNHRLFALDRAVRERQLWCVGDRAGQNEFATPIYRMSEQTVGIIGFGKIGTATALKAVGLGMKVLAYDPYVFEGVITSHGAVPVVMNGLLERSDYISIHTPLNEETSGMISDRQFERMKRTCYFVNTARGGCVDEDALIRALEKGLIAGAGIDVTSPEPILPTNPLLRMPNVILTGHSAGISLTADPNVWGKPMTQVVKALRGEWPLYAVNTTLKERWMQRWGGR